MKREEICLNTLDGCIWGYITSWVVVSRIARINHNVTVEYIGNYITFDSDDVYAVFHIRNTNYFVKIEE